MARNTFIPSGIVILTMVLGAQNQVEQGKTDAVHRVSFAQDIQPILAANCYKCHGPALQMGRLRLDAKRTALAGGQSGKVIQPGNAASSILYQRIAGLSKQERM